MNSVDDKEVAQFDAIADDWWSADGKFRPLHQINPVRLRYIRERVSAHKGLDHRSLKPFTGLTFLDVGCGGGLISEPLARLGASVTGIDPSEAAIRVAREHAAAQGLQIEYRQETVESLLQEDRTFDCVLSLEVIEHVPDVAAFLESCAAALRPGGLLVLSTLNRTARSFALGIVAAEYVFGWLPRGTHQWNRFITPEELRDHLDSAGLTLEDETGLAFDPIQGQWSLSSDCSVNYMVAASKGV